MGDARWLTFAAILAAVAGALGALLASGAAVTLMPIALVAIPSAVFAAMAPTTWLLTLLGFLLPVWTIWQAPPVAFDALRVAVSIAITVRCQVSVPPSSRAAINSWAASIAVLGGLLLMVPATRGEYEPQAVVVLAAVAVALLVSLRCSNPWWLWRGFVAGVAFSAAIGVSGLLGGIDLSPLQSGNFRMTGLASRAPRFGFEAAIAAIISFVALASGRRPRQLWYASLVVSLVTVMLSGGRGGLVALGAALVLATLRGWIRPLPLIGSAIAVGFSIWWFRTQGFAISTYDRLIGAEGTRGLEDFSGGRIPLIPQAMQAILSRPWAGYGSARFMEANGVMPHSPILSFGVASGLIAAVLALAMTARLVLSTVRSRGSDSADKQAAHLVATVLIVTVFVEPDGPFVGLELLLMLFVGVSAISSEGEGKRAGSILRIRNPRSDSAPALPSARA